MQKKLLKFFITILIIAIVFIVMILSKEKNTSEIEDTSIEIETLETPQEMTEVPIVENSDTEIIDSGVVSFTDEEKEQVNDAFTSFLTNEEYQTTIQEGDTLVYITFKNLGTVTFKMYDKTAPDAVEWFSSLVNENKKIDYSDKEHGTRMKDNSVRWDFVTTERVYNREEQVSEIFLMKYCLYQKLYSCNNFYICLSDYIENETDNANVPEEYISYLKKYGGDFTLYQNCIVLGRAVENQEILDKLDETFEIEKIEVVKGENLSSIEQQIENNEDVELSTEESIN